MITFDLLKIVTRLEYIKVLNEDRFEKKIKGDNITSKIFAIKLPYQLSIKINYEEQELAIEFSGKILGEKYSDLISINTIRQCFDNICSLGLCSLDVEKIIQDSEVVRCDVTKDVTCDDFNGLTSFINGAIKNRRQYITRVKRNGNLVIDKNADGNNYKRRITIYSKEREMNMVENIRFKNAYNIPSDQFDRKCRFEMNLNSMQQIRSALRIQDNKLLSVLKAESEPIAEFMNEVLADDSKMPVTDFKEYQAYLVLKDNDFDLDKVEAKLRTLYSRCFHQNREMAIYRKIMSNSQDVESGLTKSSVLKMLTSCQNNTVSQ